MGTTADTHDVERYLDAWELARLERDLAIQNTGYHAGAEHDKDDG